MRGYERLDEEEFNDESQQLTATPGADDTKTFELSQLAAAAKRAQQGDMDALQDFRLMEIEDEEVMEMPPRRRNRPRSHRLLGQRP